MLPSEDLADAHLTIDAGEQILHVDNHGLDLDNKQHSARRVPRDQIDAASFAVMVERALRLGQPAGTLEQPCPFGLEPRMVGIQQPMEITARHAEVDPKRRPERMSR